MSDEAFRSLCRRYQAAFRELVPIVDAEGCRDAEGRVVSGTHIWGAAVIARAVHVVSLVLLGCATAVSSLMHGHDNVSCRTARRPHARLPTVCLQDDA